MSTEEKPIFLQSGKPSIYRLPVNYGNFPPTLPTDHYATAFSLTNTGMDATKQKRSKMTQSYMPSLPNALSVYALTQCSTGQHNVLTPEHKLYAKTLSPNSTN